MRIKNCISALIAATLLCGAPALAETTVKVGVINTYSGPLAATGDGLQRGIDLYTKLHQNELPAGVTIELIKRDDTGVNPEVAKRLAQELITHDKVQLLTGVVWTPNALSIAPLATEAKVPFVIMNAGTAMITTKSPYIARVSFTMWESNYPLGTWAAKNGLKNVFTMVSDYGPGIDAETAFSKAFIDGGGTIAGSVRMPVTTPDFVPFLQRAKDTKPDAVFCFVPASKQATAFMKAFGDLGLTAAGVKLIGPGDITPDEELPGMGDVALGTITMHHYSSALDTPENKAFVAAYKQAYGADAEPGFEAVDAYDGMAAIYAVVKAQNGNIDPDKTMELLKGWKDASPRGPISIDPETRDIVQNEYLRRVDKVNGQLQNTVIETTPAVKDPWKEINKAK
jgi:branched-chain amino acid transport system substrate-binding protein